MPSPPVASACLLMAFVDSLGWPGDRLVGGPRIPRLVDDDRHGIDVVRALPCDLLLTPHPDGSGWDPGGAAHPHPQSMTCPAYADAAAGTLDAERAKQRREGAR